ncbi:MAG: hypothetical protein ACLQBJ_09620 [Bryobacteraceae bacterium]
MSLLRTHPDAPTLALLAGGELPFWPRSRARWHVRLCPRCQAALDQFLSLRAELRAEALKAAPAALSGLDWSAFEAEMRANIRLGLTAGALAGQPDGAAPPLPPPSLPLWRWAAVGAALVFVLGAGWWLGVPRHAPTPVVSSVLKDVAEAERPPAAPAPRFELLAPASAAVRTEADFNGGTHARLIDGDTGQVTLQQVYAE